MINRHKICSVINLDSAPYQCFWDCPYLVLSLLSIPESDKRKNNGCMNNGITDIKSIVITIIVNTFTNTVFHHF